MGGGFSHFLVYASSALAEQSTPAFLQIDDRRAIASSVSFDDFDLDLGELGGTLSWVPAFDVHLITMFNVYLATDAFGADREMKLSSSSSSVAIVPDTPLRSFTHLLIYAASSLVEQSTPGALLLADTSATAENLSLPDFDLDEKDLGGTLAWDEPLDTTKAMGGLVVSTHVAIYTLSTLVEQTTPAMLEIVNAIASVSGTSFVDKVDNVSFPDEDLDRGDLGGILEWSPPLDISQAKATRSDRTVCVAA
ncbi:unnamed protein product [Durusdinium trenchii]|uniref:Uncharacterized protein n=1 Tax=Durusdinium trenchii TaxID=1381693 RepID=A0ABP0SRN5_9DINO